MGKSPVLLVGRRTGIVQPVNKSEEQLIARATDAVKGLQCVVGELSEQIKSQQEWFKSRFELATLHDLKRMENRIMATQAEVVAELTTLKGQVGKIRTEVTDAKTELQDTIKRLEDVIAAGNTGQASAELVAIKDELKAEFQTLDDLHLDKVPV